MKKTAVETKEVTEVKETTTTLESLLKGKELTSFKAAQKTWGVMQKDAQKMLESMGSVGSALNTLYNKGAVKGLKKDAITVMVRKYFPGLDRRERSEYRKLANNLVEITLFVEFEGVKSANPTYLVNAWGRAVKEDCQECKEIEKHLAGGFDVQGMPMNKPDTLTPTPTPTPGVAIKEGNTPGAPISTIEPTIKTGLQVKANPLTAQEVTTQLGYICNQAKTLHNEGKLKAEHLADIEKHLTSCLQHINNVDVEAQIDLLEIAN